MLKTIRISGYKVINDKPLELLNLARVNYLVGKNGSGKSSILELIMMVFNAQYYNQDDGINDRLGYPLTLFNPNFTFEYSNENQGNETSFKICLDHYALESGKAVLVDAKDQDLTFKLGDIAHYFDISNSRTTIPHKENLNLDLDTLPDFITPGKLKDFVNKNHYFKQKVISIISSPTKDRSLQFLLENEQKVNLKTLSSGQVASIAFYFNLQNKIEALLKYKENAHKGNPDYFHIVCIEEAETHLHPSLQKIIPMILNEFVASNAVMFFIATHSPFIISRSMDFSDSQKVYLIEDGQTMDEKGTIGCGKNGFSEKSVNQIAAKMLGADETDFGYVENYCLVEEPSLQKILDVLKEQKIIKDWGFISSSGNKNVDKISEKIKQFNNEKTLLKCNPFYYDKYCIIIDKPTESNFSESLEYKKLNSLNTEIQPNRFTILTEKNLEDYYESTMKQEFIREKATIDLNTPYAADNGEGMLKFKYAELAAQKILEASNPKEKFSEMFKNKLDFLLR